MKNKATSLPPERILTVDQDQRIRQLIRVNLEADGLQVCEAESRSQCSNLIAEEACQLLLLSLDLPPLEMMRTISEFRRQAGWTVPVLLVVSEIPPKSLLQNLGSVEYIRKPFDAAQLAVSVHRLLQGPESGGELSRAI